MATGAAKARATLKYSPELYTPYALESWSESQMRKEYTRLRDIAQKRIKRIQQANRFAQTSDVYKEFKTGFPKLRDITSKKDLGKALADVSRFVQARGSTVGGARELFRQRLKRAGVKEEDVKNVYSINEWMEIVRLQYSRELFDSDLAVLYYKDRQGINLTIEDYEAWLVGESEYSDQTEVEPDSSSEDWDWDEI